MIRYSSDHNPDDSAGRMFVDTWAVVAAYEGGIEAAADATGIPVDVYDRGLHRDDLTPREDAESRLKFIDYIEASADIERMDAIDRLFANLGDSRIEKLIELCEAEDGPALEAMLRAFDVDDEDIFADDSAFWAWFRDTFYSKQ